MNNFENSVATAGVVGTSAYLAGFGALVATDKAPIAVSGMSAHQSMSAAPGNAEIGNWSAGVPKAARLRRAGCTSVSLSTYRERSR